MSEINNERNSAPTGASEIVNEMNKEANEPLGGASCFGGWGNTFEEAVIAIIKKREGDKESAKAKYLRDYKPTPDEAAVMIRKGKFPYPDLNRF